MKRFLLMIPIAVLFTVVAAFAGESAASAVKQPVRATSPQLQARHVDDPSQGVTAASDLPTVSKFQEPKAIPNIGCMGGENGDPCIDDGGGGYTQGGCNCGRLCGNGSGCLLSVSNNG